MLCSRAAMTSSTLGWVINSDTDGAVIVFSKATQLGAASAVARIEEWESHSAMLPGLLPRTNDTGFFPSGKHRGSALRAPMLSGVKKPAGP